jgi:hypothetical protein
MTPVKLDLPYLMADIDRHGNRRIFVRRNGRKIRLREEIGTRAFLEAYKASLMVLDEIAGPTTAATLYRTQGLAGLACRPIFRLARIQGTRSEIPIDATVADRGLLTRTAQTRLT